MSKGRQYVESESKLSKSVGKSSKSDTTQSIVAFLNAASPSDLEKLQAFIKKPPQHPFQEINLRNLYKVLKILYPDTFGKIKIVKNLLEKIQACWGAMKKETIQLVDSEQEEGDEVDPAKMTLQGYQQNDFVVQSLSQEEIAPKRLRKALVQTPQSSVVKDEKYIAYKAKKQEEIRQKMKRQKDLEVLSLDEQLQFAKRLNEQIGMIPRKINPNQTPKKKIAFPDKSKSQPKSQPKPQISKIDDKTIMDLINLLKNQNDNLQKELSSIKNAQNVVAAAPAIPTMIQSQHIVTMRTIQCVDCTALINQVIISMKTDGDNAIKVGTSYMNSKSTAKFGTKLCKRCNDRLLQQFAILVKKYLKKALNEQSCILGVLASRLPAYMATKLFQAQSIMNKEFFVLEKLGDFLALRIFYPVDKNTTIWQSNLNVKQHLILSKDTNQWRLATGIYGANSGLQPQDVIHAINKKGDQMLAFLQDFIKILNDTYLPDYSFSTKRKTIAAPLQFDLQ